jgi:hypothetical protein
MIRIALVCLILAGCSGCASMPGAGAAVLKNLEGCERHYSGVVTAGLGAGFSGSVEIRCAPAVPPNPG